MYTPEIYVPICIVLVHEHIAEILSKRVSDAECYFVGFRSRYSVLCNRWGSLQMTDTVPG